MATYSKVRTQFDGVETNELVSYLKMDHFETLYLPVLSTGKVDTPLNFTVSMWLKITDLTVDPTEIHYLFSLEDSARCYISLRRSLICDTSNRDQLEI